MSGFIQQSSAGETRSFPLAFRGEGESLLLLWLKNIALTLLTLGLYLPWAKAAQMRFLISGVEIGGSRLRFTGTGREIALGMLLAGGFFLAFFITSGFLATTFGDRSPVLLAYLIVGGFGIQFLAQAAIFSSIRYRLGRTLLKEIRFLLRGSPWDFAKAAFPRFLLILLTLGFYYPFFAHWRSGYLLSRLQYGSIRFGFDAPKSEFVRRAYKGFFLSVLTFGIYGFFFIPAWEAFKRRHTLVGESRLHCDYAAGSFFLLWLTNLLLSLFTLGFALPWVMVRSLRYFVDKATLSGPTRFEDALQIAPGMVSPSSEFLSEALDANVGLDLGL